MSEVEVYGADHSPWVQAVLLGLHDKGIPHTLRTVPPWTLFSRSGILMPAARIDGADWQRDSYEILEHVGYAPVSDEDLGAIYAAWGGVHHRVDDGMRFWRAFSLIQDPNPSLVLRLRNHFLRSFATFYFFVLIHVMRRMARVEDPESFVDQFLYWERKLERSPGPFLDGQSPDTLDMLLFGVIQCHASIPVPPLESLQESPALPNIRAWLAAMHQRFSNYGHLYSGACFEPRLPVPSPSSRLDQAAFWLGAAFMFSSFPMTIPLVLFFALRVQRLPSRRFRPGHVSMPTDQQPS